MKRILFLSFVILMSISLSAQNTLSKKFDNSKTTARSANSKKVSKRVDNDLSQKLIKKANVHSVSNKSKTAIAKSGLKIVNPLSKIPNKAKKAVQLRETTAVIWTDDFSNPANWTIGNNAGNNQNWVISTTGPTGFYSSGMGIISSPTAANGFALYDSDAIGTATNALGDQDAFIRTTNSIDLTGHSLVKVKFYQSYRKYNSQTFVSVKVGTSAWVDIEVNGNLGTNDAVEGFKEVDISSIAGNQSNVKIQFLYFGEWDYAWMVDDVSIEDAFVNDAATQYVFTLGELPVGQSNQVTAIVENVGAGDIANLDVTLNITGANTFTNVQSLTNLLVGDIVEVTFDAFTPTTIGANNVTVSVASDNNNANNSASYYQYCDASFAYADTSDNASSLGYNTGEGLILTKYTTNSACTVDDVDIFIADSSAVGNTVYAVVLNSTGTIVAQSANHIVSLADLNTWVNFPIPTVAGFNNEDFYTGIAQTANATTGYYPLGTQAESYVRNGAYYIAGLTGGTVSEANTYGRFMIRANLGTALSDDIGIVDLISPSNASSCSLTTNEVVTVSIENFGSQSATGFTVSYSINGGTPQTETVTTTIPAGSTQNYTFTGTVDMSAVQAYDILTYVTLAGDQNTANDTADFSVMNGDATITVEIQTDAYPEETSWGLFNSANDLVYVGGNYADTGTTYITDVCVLSTECYTFLILDAYGDGIYQPGYYEVSYNNVYVGGNTNFTSDAEYIFNVGGGCPANELGVDMVYTIGQLPKNQGSPHTVSALIYNYGTDTQTNVNVTLDITGANTFTDVQVIPSILAGEEVLVTFLPYSPSSNGVNDITVSLPNDEDITNNSYSQYQNVNNTVYSYADTSANDGGIGYGNGTGLLFNKHYMNGTGQVIQVAFMVSGDVNTVGNDIYAVVLDSDTNVVAQSANHTITTGELETILYLDLTTAVSFTNEEFYIGIAQTENTVTAYYPLATQAEPFTRSDTYYGSAIDGTGAVDYTGLDRFYIEAILAYGPGWTYTNTGSNHTILIPNTIDLLINGNPIEIGDYIGVFYDQSGVEACGGYIMYDGGVGALTAWGAQSGMDDGFQANEVFSWRIWDATDDTEYSAVATYNILDFPNEDFYVTNGMSGLASLIATSSETQTVASPLGWSIFSTYIDVFEPSLDSIFSPVISDVSIIKDGNGHVFWPLYGVNAIGNVTIGEGYQIKTNIAISTDFTGLSVVPETTVLNIDAGWSILGYLRQSPADIEIMMATIATNIDIMKNGSGDVYWPLYGVNGIGNMIPGEGYQMKLGAAATFSFPANTGQTMKNQVVRKPAFFNTKINTGHNMTIGFPSSCISNKLTNGDEIAAFNKENKMVGSGVYTNGNFVLTAWGNDDISSVVDGLLKDETITFKVWNHTTNSINELTVTEWEQGDGNYSDNNISIAKSINIIEQTQLLQNYPNPFSANTNISFILSGDSNVKIEIYNLLGEKLETIFSQELSAGTHSVQFNSANYSNGTYFYRLVTNNYIETKSLSIQK